MGFMTEISFLNDGWHHLKREIEENPKKFTEAIDELMHGVPIYGMPDESGRREFLGYEHPGDIDRLMHIGGGSTVYPSHHADDPRLYLAWQNSFLDMSAWSLKKEFGERLDRANDHILDVLERDVREAQRILTDTKKMIKEKRAALAAS